MDKKEIAKNQKKMIPLIYDMASNIISRFMTNMTVQIIQNEFKISFFEQQSPIILDIKKTPKEIHATCVASVIVTADRLPGIIEVLQKQLDLYRKEANKK